jgi:hypothetical protein
MTREFKHIGYDEGGAPLIEAEEPALAYLMERPAWALDPDKAKAADRAWEERYRVLKNEPKDS